jgi:hypothetical protein
MTFDNDGVIIATPVPARDTEEDCSLESDGRIIPEFPQRDSTILPPPSGVPLPVDYDQQALDALASIGDAIDNLACAIREHTVVMNTRAIDAAADSERRTDQFEAAANLFKDFMERWVGRL